MCVIKEWYVTTRSDGYTAPELLRPQLCGRVYGHPKHSDGTQVVTSYIVEAEGRRVATYSGTVYNLGNISPSYRRHLKKIRPEWNWRKPFEKV